MKRDESSSLKSAASIAGHREIRRLQVKTSRLANGIFTGEYRSAFKGRGIEFQDLREYSPGDDIRDIDWRVTARLERPFVKQFLEERELTLFILLDCSASMDFGTTRSTKLQSAIEASAILSFAALRSNDRVGLISYTSDINTLIPPAKGNRHVMRLVHEAHAAPRGDASASLETALGHMSGMTRNRAIVFIFSDFLDPIPLKTMKTAAACHDVVAARLVDPVERVLPSAGLISVVDQEDGSARLVDSTCEKVRESYRQLAAARDARIFGDLASTGADCMTLETGTPPIHQLARFFHNRRQQKRR